MKGREEETERGRGNEKAKANVEETRRETRDNVGVREKGDRLKKVTAPIPYKCPQRGREEKKERRRRKKEGTCGSSV